MNQLTYCFHFLWGFHSFTPVHYDILLHTFLCSSLNGNGWNILSFSSKFKLYIANCSQKLFESIFVTVYKFFFKKMYFILSSYLVRTSEETLCSPSRLLWTFDYCLICCCCYCCFLFFNCMYKKWQRSRKVQTKIQYVNLNSHPVSAWRWEGIQYTAKGSQDVFIAPRITIELTVWSGLIRTTIIGQIYTPWLFVSSNCLALRILGGGTNVYEGFKEKNQGKLSRISLTLL